MAVGYTIGQPVAIDSRGLLAFVCLVFQLKRSNRVAGAADALVTPPTVSLSSSLSVRVLVCFWPLISQWSAFKSTKSLSLSGCKWTNQF